MQQPFRKIIRLQSYDYSTQGAYFVTCCTHNRQHLLSTIANGIATNTRWGEIVHEVWSHLPDRYPVVLDEIVLMPDHLHCVLFITGKDPHALPHEPVVSAAGMDHRRQRRSMLLFKIMGYWKSTVTKEVRSVGFKGEFWQPRYNDHIIRNDNELHRIRQYIRTNPARWP